VSEVSCWEAISDDGLFRRRLVFAHNEPQERDAVWDDIEDCRGGDCFPPSLQTPPLMLEKLLLGQAAIRTIRKKRRRLDFGAK
jgi:hypothetical protein